MASTKLTNRPLPVQFDQSGCAALQSHHASDFRMPLCRHPFSKFVLVLAGRGRLIDGNGKRTYDFKDDCAFWIPPKVKHSFSDKPGAAAVLHIICFRIENFPEADCLGELRNEVGVLAAELTSTLHGAVRALAYSIRMNGSMTNRKMLAYALLNRIESLLRSNKKNHRFIQSAKVRVKQYVQEMEEHPYRDENLEEASRRTGLSRRRFTTLFRELTGTSWLAFRRRAQIQHACELIKFTHLNLTTIAFESGFQDLSTFHRAFRDGTGCSPSQFKKRQRPIKDKRSFE